MDVLALARVCQYFEIRAGGFGYGFRVTRVDGCEIDEVAAHAEGARAGLDEAFGGFERNATGGNDLEMREWREQGFQVACATNRRAGKDLHVISASVPRGNNFSGRER